MDGESHGKPYCLMDDLGVPLFLETPIYIYAKLGCLMFSISSIHLPPQEKPSLMRIYLRLGRL